MRSRARLIADRRGHQPGTTHHREVEAFALKMLREAVDQALKKSGNEWPGGAEWV